MRRWLRIIRGMIGTGLTFSAGVGLTTSVAAVIIWLLTGLGDITEFGFPVVALTIWAFPVGIAFSGFLALTAGRRSFDELSFLRFAALGAGGGLLLYGALALNAWDAWTLRNAISNAVIFLGLGSGSATAALWLARSSGPALESGEEARSLPEG